MKWSVFVSLYRAHHPATTYCLRVSAEVTGEKMSAKGEKKSTSTKMSARVSSRSTLAVDNALVRHSRFARRKRNQKMTIKRVSGILPATLTENGLELQTDRYRGLFFFPNAGNS